MSTYARSTCDTNLKIGCHAFVHQLAVKYCQNSGCRQWLLGTHDWNASTLSWTSKKRENESSVTQAMPTQCHKTLFSFIYHRPLPCDFIGWSKWIYLCQALLRRWSTKSSIKSFVNKEGPKRQRKKGRVEGHSLETDAGSTSLWTHTALITSSLAWFAFAIDDEGEFRGFETIYFL